jgi:hypothetical protein
MLGPDVHTDPIHSGLCARRILDADCAGIEIGSRPYKDNLRTAAPRVRQITAEWGIRRYGFHGLSHAWSKCLWKKGPGVTPWNETTPGGKHRGEGAEGCPSSSQGRVGLASSLLGRLRGGGLPVSGTGGEALAEVVGLGAKLKQMTAVGEAVEQRRDQAGVGR